MLSASSKKGSIENLRHVWQMKSSGVSVQQRGIIDMSAPDQANCYGIVIDESNFEGDLLSDPAFKLKNHKHFFYPAQKNPT